MQIIFKNDVTCYIMVRYIILKRNIEKNALAYI